VVENKNTYLHNHAACHHTLAGALLHGIFIPIADRGQLEFQWPLWKGKRKMENQELTLTCFHPELTHLLVWACYKTTSDFKETRKYNSPCVQKGRRVGITARKD
jgi:hypothetical protein